MDLVGGNANLGPEAVFEAVGEAGGGVDHHRTGIHLGEEAPGAAEVLTDNGLGMTGAVAADMVEGLVEAAHDLDGEDRRQILGAPVFLAGGVAGDQPGGALTAPQLDALAGVGDGQTGQDLGGDRLRHQQGFHGVAHPVTVGLGV